MDAHFQINYCSLAACNFSFGGLLSSLWLYNIISVLFARSHSFYSTFIVVLPPNHGLLWIIPPSLSSCALTLTYTRSALLSSGSILQLDYMREYIHYTHMTVLLPSTSTRKILFTPTQSHPWLSIFIFPFYHPFHFFFFIYAFGDKKWRKRF